MRVPDKVRCLSDCAFGDEQWKHPDEPAKGFLYHVLQTLSDGRFVLLGLPKMRAYRCPVCDGWHLTSKPKI